MTPIKTLTKEELSKSIFDKSNGRYEYIPVDRIKIKNQSSPILVWDNEDCLPRLISMHTISLYRKKGVL